VLQILLSRGRAERSPGERVSRKRSGMAVGAERAACGARHAERDAPRARQLRSRGVRVEHDGRGPWHARSAHACEQSGAAQHQENMKKLS
jgi:hypothetical protein